MLERVKSAGDQAPDMGKVYDDFAEKFAEADRLPTWIYVGKLAMEKILRDSLRPGKIFLDLGSASGRVEAGVLLPNGVRPEDIVGIEISPEQVEIAKTRIPGATFAVGDISDPTLLDGHTSRFDVVFSHMVFEHLSDEQFERVCKNAFRLLKPGGTFAFVVTHPDKMTDLNGDLVTGYGAFETTAPWGGILHNWRRSVKQTVDMVRESGFDVGTVEELPFPAEAPDGLAPEELEVFDESARKYRRYPAIRLSLVAKKPRT